MLQEGIKLAPEQIGFAMTLARLQVDRGDGPGAIATLQGSLAHAQASPALCRVSRRAAAAAGPAR